MIQYVTGYAFNEAGNKVLLIRKNRPERLAGKLNGIGGRIEPTDQSPLEAMHREFTEETAITERLLWDSLARITAPEYVIHVFTARSEAIFHHGYPTDEAPIICPVKRLLTREVDYTLHWLIPLALDPRHQFTEVYYK